MVRAFLAEKGLLAWRTQGFLDALRAYYRWRKKVRGEAVEDPTAPVARPRTGRRIPHHPSREDLERLLGGLEGVAKGDTGSHGQSPGLVLAGNLEGEPEAGLLKALLRFLHGTGLRLSEAVGLDLESLLQQPPFRRVKKLLRHSENECDWRFSTKHIDAGHTTADGTRRCRGYFWKSQTVSQLIRTVLSHLFRALHP